MTFQRIVDALSGMSNEAIIECAVRWRYFATVLGRSVESVGLLVESRCAGVASVEATGVLGAVVATQQLAAQWRTIGDALHCFGIGVRGATDAIATVASKRASDIALFNSHFDLLCQQPMVVESYERKARADFDEHYSSGLFAFVSGMRCAGDPMNVASHGGQSLLGAT